MKIIVQSTGEFDFESLFNDGGLLYSPMAYILFISFVVLMPILFSNMLVIKLAHATHSKHTQEHYCLLLYKIGLAVGTADEDRKNAEFTNIQLQAGFNCC